MKKPMFLTRGRAVFAMALFFAMAALFVTPASPNSSPSLHTYSDSKMIAVAQGVLQHEGYLAPGSYTRGESNAATVRAMTAFQSHHTLLPTGVMNDETITQILSHSGQFDSDRDGVTDDLDRCPTTAKGTPVDTEGCPRDTDQDSVSDLMDRCPDTARSVRVDNQGCPLDGDRDAVYDGLDRCPDTARGAQVDAWGCVQETRPAETRPASIFHERKQLVLEGVNFATDTAVLTPESRVILDRVAESLKAWPETQVEISGYADSINTDAYNLRLSGERAEAVRVYLMNAGVPGTQVVAKGYGETHPIADNDTAKGRAENRRVEIAQID